MKAYELIAHAVLREGVDTAFAVMGDGNMKWLKSFEDQGGRVIYCRHESSAAGMAEGYARVTGRPAVASVTCGPGLSLIATTLIIASRNRTPLLVIAGDPPQADIYYQQRFDQSRFVGAAEATHHELRTADTTAEDMRTCFGLIRSGQPCVLSAAFDVQEHEVDGESVSYQPTAEMFGGQQAIAPAEEPLQRAAEMIANAERPAILAGRGAFGARSEIELLAERTGAVLATTMRAKGMFEGHPRDLGVAGGLARAATRETLTRADCLIAVGASLNQYSTQAGMSTPDASVIQISVHREELIDGRRVAGNLPGGKRSADCYIQGDARRSVQLLIDRLPERQPSAWAAPVNDGARTALAQPSVEVADGKIHPRDAMLSLSRVAREGTRFAIGIGHFWQFPISFLAGGDETSYLFVPEFGAIGQTFSAALGAAVADPSRPMILIEGDGSLMMSIQEIDTAVRYGIKLVIVVMNDDGLAAEFHKLDSLGIDTAGARIPSPDFARVAESFGAQGFTATSLEEFCDAVQAAQAADVPALIDARISDAVINDSFWNAFFAEQRAAAY